MQFAIVHWSWLLILAMAAANHRLASAQTQGAVALLVACADHLILRNVCQSGHTQLCTTLCNHTCYRSIIQSPGQVSHYNASLASHDLYAAGLLLPGYCPSAVDLSALVPAPTAGPVAAAAGDCQALVNYAVLGISGAVACAAVVIENLQKVAAALRGSVAWQPMPACHQTD
jgi:hypothetical protein